MGLFNKKSELFTLLAKLDNLNAETLNEVIEGLDKLRQKGFNKKETQGLIDLGLAFLEIEVTGYDIPQLLILYGMEHATRKQLQPVVERFREFAEDTQLDLIKLPLEAPPSEGRVHFLGDLIDAYVDQDVLPYYQMDFSRMIQEPELANLMLQRLAPHKRSKEFSYSFYSFALTLLGHELGIEKYILPLKDDIMAHYKETCQIYTDIKEQDHWQHTEQGKHVHTYLPMITDLLGHYPGQDVFIQLIGAMTIIKHNPTVLAAALSILRREGDLTETVIEQLAADPETRAEFLRIMDGAGKLDQVPEAYQSAEAIAEAALVAWLTHPNELTTAPDEIEFIQHFDQDEEGRYYLYRFRCFEPHWAAATGWTAGMAGPYHDGQGKIGEGQFTFSRFESWDEQSAEDHFKAIRNNMLDWAQHAAGADQLNLE